MGPARRLRRCRHRVPLVQDLPPPDIPRGRRPAQDRVAWPQGSPTKCLVDGVSQMAARRDRCALVLVAPVPKATHAPGWREPDIPNTLSASRAQLRARETSGRRRIGGGHPETGAKELPQWTLVSPDGPPWCAHPPAAWALPPHGRWAEKARTSSSAVGGRNRPMGWQRKSPQPLLFRSTCWPPTARTP